ncbi:methyltransferase domain-containing protein [Pseudonocardia pini]|uniref:methyltransferase domain-containing protein n=1 Tax=Pseudonocardia pini TaxID=2758030 RepID=UPI0015EFF2FC|nr:methyltransferase domain-containing protein [Pseudonocardia pini]
MRDVYTHGHHDSVLRSHRNRTVENSAGYLVPLLRPGLDLLDVGCGPGTVTHDLASRVAPGRVRGVDVVEAPLVEARAQGGGVEFAVDDVYRLSDPDDSWDVVHAHQVLQHLSDPVAALREMRRVTRPGGVVAARDADYAAFTWYPAEPRLDAWLELYRAVAHSNDAEPDAGRRLLAWAHAAGFTEVTPTASVWCYATPEARAWWGGLWADRILQSAIAEQAVDRGLATRADLEDLSAGWRSWAAEPDGWFLLPHGEILARA